MSAKDLETEFLTRVEGLLDALETREKNSSEFLTLCSELQLCLETAQVEKVTQKQLADVSGGFKDRIERIVKRITMLELFASTQTEITANLQKHIVGADK